MKKLLAALVSALLLCSTAFAIDDPYNPVPAGDKQYAACLVYSKKNWEGGDEKSPINGKSKAQAFCSCMWNETPDDFKGSLAKFSETDAGKKTNKICEKHSNWSDN